MTPATPALRCLAVALVAASLIGACSKRPIANETPKPLAESPPTPAPRAAPAETPQPVATPTPTPPPAMPKQAEERPPTPGQLQRDYWLTRDQAERIEIIYQLGDIDTVEAVHSLTSLYQVETDVDLKQEILDAADRIEEQIPAKLALLNVALAPGQPAEMHDTVIEMLLGINDRQAIFTWQRLLKDPDPDIRELAQQQIEELQKLDTN